MCFVKGQQDFLIPIWLALAGKVSFARPSKARQASKRTKHAQRILAAPKCIDLSTGTHPS